MPTTASVPSLVRQTWTFHIELEDDPERGVVVASCREHPEVTATATTADEAVEAIGERLVAALSESWQPPPDS